MRLVLARCSVDYVGRLTAHLPEAVRLLVVKADGSVLVHSDTGGYKPLMWMTPPCTLLVGDDTWSVTNKGGELLVISVLEVLSDVSHELGTDPGLVKDGVEKQLQALLADQCHVLGEGFTPNDPNNLTAVVPALTASAITGNNTATWNPRLILAIPGGATHGTYTATVTHSVV